MGKKLQQVTDNIHGTIYLSDLESELISTPYFYRLHDIYQSSTVYMTFPSNRTKRYEHSLGAMELASVMLYTSVLNADSETKTKLFEKLDEYFNQVYDLVINNFESQTAPYLAKNKDLLAELFSEESENITEDTINNNIKEAVEAGCFTDSALDFYQYYPMQNDSQNNSNGIKNFFLYRCLLQSVRIVSLFHDVGHPPYSHIIEEVLNSLSDDITEKISAGNKDKKLNDFSKCMNNYSEKLKTQTLFSKMSLPDETKAALHERIGLSFLQSAINDTIPDIIQERLNSDRANCCKMSSVLYYTLVVEFIFSMLVERDIFFKSFHKIVDGVLDADRLDYITRDSINSGVDWGRISYKRLINSSKLVYLKEFNGSEIAEAERPFVIAYPQKVSDDIVDLLLVRYKIFARINFHHRCMKTAAALKSSVTILSEDYLMCSDDKKCINADINMLWASLGLNAGDRKKRVILWNDSWLISTLYRSLINLNGKKGGQANVLKENLEEILLNKKRFYSLLKRKTDNQQFIKKIFVYSGINEDIINALINKERNKLFASEKERITKENLLQSSKADAYDSLSRIEGIISDGDIEVLNQLIPPTKNIQNILLETLDGLKTDGYIIDYGIIFNNGRNKTGLPMHKDILDEIYLYKDNNCFTFDEYASLKPQIDIIFKDIPWLYLYIAPGTKLKNTNELMEKILDECAKSVGLQVKNRFNELFPNIPSCN